MIYSAGNNGRDPLSEFITYLGLIVITIVAILIFLFLIGCSDKIIEHTETVVEYRDREIHDTVKIDIPKEVLVNVTTDTVSTLETSYAYSKATVSNGLLYHTLKNKDTTITKPITIHVTDTVYKTVTKKEKVPVPVIEKVEKKLSWWQRVRLDTYYILLGVIILFAIIKYRKSIFSLTKSFR